MTTHLFNLAMTHPSWRPILERGLSSLSPDYIQTLLQSPDWLPGINNIFNAFSLPLNEVNYVLFGESPYPRKASANGYAFWDADVHELWSADGLSKKVNRATSLRNIIKMLLVADHRLAPDCTTQAAISHLDKKSLIQTNDDLFKNFLEHGFLLLNATLVLRDAPPQQDARAWLPFIQSILQTLLAQRPQVKLILFGRIANTIDNILPNVAIDKIYAEHPYNLTFITNPKVLDFFKPLNLLSAKSSAIA